MSSPIENAILQKALFKIKKKKKRKKKKSLVLFIKKLLKIVFFFFFWYRIDGNGNHKYSFGDCDILFHV